jgi:hypothetical protein
VAGTRTTCWSRRVRVDHGGLSTVRSEGFGEVVCAVMSVGGADEIGGGSGRSHLPWGAAPTEASQDLWRGRALSS